MKITKITMVILIFFIFCSCKDENELIENYASEESLKEFIGEYYNRVKNNTRGENTFEILDKESRRYKILEDTIVEMDIRTLSKVPSDDEFDIENVKLKFDEKEGYAIVSRFNNRNRMHVFCEDGEISDTTYACGLKQYIDYIPLFILYEYQNDLQTQELIYDISINPIVKYQWHQGYPFNMYGIYCNCSKCSKSFNRNKRPAGCVPTALAQLFATVGKFTGTFYGNKDIEFENLPVIADDNTSDKIKKTLGHFFHEIALCCQLKYDCDGSGTSFEAAYNYICDLGYKSKLVSGSLDNNQLIIELKKGFPHLMAGSTDGGDRHAWLIDGIRTTQYNQYSYHCNWGVVCTWTDGLPYYCNYTDIEDKNIKNYYQRNLQHIYIDSI